MLSDLKFRLLPWLCLTLLFTRGCADVTVRFFTARVESVVQVTCRNASVKSVFAINVNITDPKGRRLELKMSDDRGEVTINHNSLADVTMLNLSGAVNHRDPSSRVDAYLRSKTSGLKYTCEFISPLSAPAVFSANVTVHNLTLLTCCVAKACPSDVSFRPASPQNVCKTNVSDISDLEVRLSHQQDDRQELLTPPASAAAPFWIVRDSDTHQLILYNRSVTPSRASLSLLVSAWNEKQHARYTCKVSASKDECQAGLEVIRCQNCHIGTATKGLFEGGGGEDSWKVALGVTVPVIVLLVVCLLLLYCRRQRTSRGSPQSAAAKHQDVPLVKQ